MENTSSKNEVLLDQLTNRVLQLTSCNYSSRVVTAIPWLWLNRRDEPTGLVNVMHEASICIILQGSKIVHLKEDVFTYDKTRFLITPIDLPVQARVSDASPEKPFLDLVIKLDRDAIVQLMLDCQCFVPGDHSVTRGMATLSMTENMLEALFRLLRLLDKPQDAKVLAPLIHKEILYYLMSSDQGASLRQVGIVGSRSHQVSNAIEFLRKNFDQPLRIEDVAKSAGMSRSTLHQHFKDLTAMSPLQYQKWMRLNEAKRLMFSEQLDAATASFRVGYDSPSQFSREYSRLFGRPPSKDVRNRHLVKTLGTI